MKKQSILFSSIVMIGVLANNETVFSDQIADPSSAETSVSATLNANDPGTPNPPTDPTDPDNGGNEPTPGGVIGEEGKLGIAYYPKAFAFSGNLGQATLSLNDRSDSMSSNATYNIGVKDATRQNNQWTLSAQLNWTNDELPGSTITLNNSTGTVMRNTNNGTDPFQTNQLVAQTDVIGSSNVTISTGGTTEIMKKEQGTVGKGTYDYRLGTLGSLQLTIPNATNLEAKTYNGTVDWNLLVTP